MFKNFSKEETEKFLCEEHGVVDAIRLADHSTWFCPWCFSKFLEDSFPVTIQKNEA